MSNLEIEIEGVTTNSVRHKISNLKNHMIMPPEFRKHHMKSVIDEKIAEVYVEYQKRLVENNAMDFDDLLLNRLIYSMQIPKYIRSIKKDLSTCW